MDPKEARDPLCKGAFTPSEIDCLRRLRKDYEANEKSQMAASHKRLLFVHWLVKTGRLTDYIV
jgi:hypothetical protein